MEFIIGLLKTMRQHDSIMIVVDRFIRVAHFILVESTFLASDVAHVFIKYVVTLHGIPKKIVSDRDVKFTSKIWKELFADMEEEM